MRTGSGGTGQHRGGEGVIRSIRVLEACEMSLLSDRRTRQPQGADGGGPGATGRNTINSRRVGAKVRASLKAGDVVTIVTPGGGGYGPAPGTQPGGENQ
jgi:N-methylhydantoinase B